MIEVSCCGGPLNAETVRVAYPPPYELRALWPRRAVARLVPADEERLTLEPLPVAVYVLHWDPRSRTPLYICDQMPPTSGDAATRPGIRRSARDRVCDS